MKRFFWLKLPKDFFRQREIKKLRQIAGGDTYTVIYLKLLLLSLDTDGKLFFEGLESDFASEMALEIDETPENVSVAVNFLLRCGILQRNTDDEYELLTAHDMTGSEGDSARRMRALRGRRVSQCDGAPLLGDSAVTSGDVEIEKDRDIYPLVRGKPERERYSPDFERFWEAYPKRQAKKKAFAAFKKACVPVDVLISAVERQKCGVEWQRDGGRYIPLPASWLNAGRWMDEVPEVEASSTKGEWNDAI